jgi:hypothetical protein
VAVSHADMTCHKQVLGARTVIAQEYHEEDFDLSSGSSKMSVYQDEGEVMLLLELAYIQ